MNCLNVKSLKNFRVCEIDKRKKKIDKQRQIEIKRFMGMVEHIWTCSRCESSQFCIMFGDLGYCHACFSTVSNDPETAENIKKLMVLYGIKECDVS